MLQTLVVGLGRYGAGLHIPVTRRLRHQIARILTRFAARVSRADPGQRAHPSRRTASRVSATSSTSPEDSS